MELLNNLWRVDMINLRWFIVKRKYEKWDSREDCWSYHFIESAPKLQQFNQKTLKWETVPTVIKESSM